MPVFILFNISLLRRSKGPSIFGDGVVDAINYAKYPKMDLSPYLFLVVKIEECFFDTPCETNGIF